MKSPVSATIAGLTGILRDQRNTPRLLDSERCDGRVALVTGANRGLGLAVASELARRGAEVIMACRSGIPEAGAAVRAASGSDNVSMRALDLADLRSVRRLCEELARDGVSIDLLVANAAVVPRAARPTAQGFELMFGVNYLANVELVERLLALGVLRSDGAAPRPRIVFVSSESHRDAGPIALSRLGRFESFGALDGMRVYGHSKLLLSTYAGELSRRLADRVGVFSTCPGAVNTDIAREAPRWLKPALDQVMMRFFRAPEAAAEPVVYLACARALEGRTGVYLHVMNEKPPAAEAFDAPLGTELLRRSQELIAAALAPTSGARV